MDVLEHQHDVAAERRDVADDATRGPFRHV
jgi:hypothetical protein